MSNAIYERLMNDLAKRNQNMISAVVARARDLQAEGYDIEQIYTNLSTQGSNHDIIIAALKVITNEHLSDLRPPNRYADIEHIVESTIYSKDPKEIVKVLTAKTSFGQIMPQQHALDLKLEKHIAFCQNSESPAIMEELHKTLKPYLHNMIIHMNMLSQNKKIVKASTDFEQKVADKYLEWFGLWAPETQKAYKKTANTNDYDYSEISIVTDENGREQTYCPMYKAEINVDNVCASSCPFFKQIKVASINEESKRCYFKK
jgi:hypothetical protein